MFQKEKDLCLIYKYYIYIDTMICHSLTIIQLARFQIWKSMSYWKHMLSGPRSWIILWVCLKLYIPVKKISVISRKFPAFLCWIRTKQQIVRRWLLKAYAYCQILFIHIPCYIIVLYMLDSREWITCLNQTADKVFCSRTPPAYWHFLIGRVEIQLANIQVCCSHRNTCTLIKNNLLQIFSIGGIFKN